MASGLLGDSFFALQHHQWKFMPAAESVEIERLIGLEALAGWARWTPFLVRGSRTCDAMS